jgi:hypothetical protein
LPKTCSLDRPGRAVSNKADLAALPSIFYL